MVVGGLAAHSEIRFCQSPGKFNLVALEVWAVRGALIPGISAVVPHRMFRGSHQLKLSGRLAEQHRGFGVVSNSLLFLFFGKLCKE